MLALVLLLAGCAAPAVVPEPAPPAGGGRIATECRLLEAAQAESRARGLTAWPDVLAGCPGHADLRPAMTLPQMTAATRAANAAVLPPAVRAMGARAGLVYRRMITRGVPESVAQTLAERPEFAAAAR